MIAKAIERNVPRARIARVLNINLSNLALKVELLGGIYEEAIDLLKDKMCPMAVFDIVRIDNQNFVFSPAQGKYTLPSFLSSSATFFA